MQQINETHLNQTVHKAFREYIKEARTLVNERWSHSEEIDEAAQSVFSAVKKRLPTCKY